MAALTSTSKDIVESTHVRWSVVRFHLPAEIADQALVRFLQEAGFQSFQVVSTPSFKGPNGKPIGDGRWGFLYQLRDYARIVGWFYTDDGRIPAIVVHRGVGWLEFTRNTVVVQQSLETWLRRAVWAATPRALDERGLPVPWVAPEQRAEALGSGRENDDDIEFVTDDGPRRERQAAADVRPDLEPADDQSIVDALAWATATAGLSPVDTEVLRTPSARDGFVEGRVWISPKGPVRVRVVVGPNADAAEVWATLLHELAHGLAADAKHGEPFQRALVRLASQCFGESGIACCIAAIGGRFSRLDAWIAIAVRAVLRDNPPPTLETGDEGQLARVISRIQKLRRLAQSQPGTPEAITACAKANDLLVRYDLGAYRVKLSAAIDESMCDRWVDVGKGAVWRRTLAAEVADWCGVFCLSRRDQGWMHFFGQYTDVVTAEWFFEIWAAHIERAAEAHIKDFKARRKLGLISGNTRSVRTNFCDSAVLGLSRKLEAVAAQSDQSGDDTPQRRAAAERFADREHTLRGTGWTTTSSKSISLNSAGLEAGAAAPMGKGVAGRSGTKGLLGG